VNVFGVEPFSLTPGWLAKGLLQLLGKIDQLIFCLDGLKVVFTT